MILTLWITTAANRDTLRLGVLCAADFSMTKKFLSSYILADFFPDHCQMLVDTVVVSIL